MGRIRNTTDSPSRYVLELVIVSEQSQMALRQNQQSLREAIWLFGLIRVMV